MQKKRVIGAALLALAVTGGVVGEASAAPGASTKGNSPAAKACQKGGFAGYTRTDGSRFSGTDACVSYVAGGGTLVGLPDLQVSGSCTPTGTVVECVFTLRNAGPGAATGNLTLEATAKVPAGTSSPTLRSDFSLEGCGSASGVAYQADPNSIAAAIGCFGLTLAPGATLEAAFVTVTGGASPSVPVQVTATVDAFKQITEWNETNNSYSNTFFAA